MSKILKPLSQEDTIEYIAQMLCGSKSAKEKLILHNLHLASKTAQKYIHLNKRIDKKIYVLLAILVLKKAVSTYNLEQGMTLESYIKLSIQVEFEKQFCLQDELNEGKPLIMNIIENLDAVESSILKLVFGMDKYSEFAREDVARLLRINPGDFLEIEAEIIDKLKEGVSEIPKFVFYEKDKEEPKKIPDEKSLLIISEYKEWLKSIFVDSSDEELIFFLNKGFNKKEELAIIYYYLITSLEPDDNLVALNLGLSIDELNVLKSATLRSFERLYNSELDGNATSNVSYQDLYEFYGNYTYDEFMQATNATVLFSPADIVILKQYFNYSDDPSIADPKRNLASIERELNLKVYNAFARMATLDKMTLKRTYENNLELFSDYHKEWLNHYFYGSPTYKDIIIKYPGKKPFCVLIRYLIRKIEKIHFNMHRRDLNKAAVEAILSEDKNIFTSEQRILLCLRYGIGYEKERSLKEMSEYIRANPHLFETIEVLAKNFVKLHDAYYNARNKAITFMFDLAMFNQKKDMDDLKVFISNEAYPLAAKGRMILKDHILLGMSYEELSKKYLLSVTQISNLVMDNIRYLKYFKYGIVKVLSNNEKDLDIFFLDKGYEEDEIKALKAAYCSGLDFKEIANLFKIKYSQLVNLNHRFIFDYAKYFYNIGTSEDEISEYINFEISQHPSDRVLNEDELKRIALEYGIKCQCNPNGEQKMIVGTNEWSLIKLIKNKLGIHQPMFGIISRQEMIKYLNDPRLPLSDAEKEMLRDIKGIETDFLDLEALGEKYGKTRPSIYFSRMYKRTILKIFEYEDGALDPNYSYEEDIVPKLKYFNVDERRLLTYKYQNKMSDIQVASLMGITRDQVNLLFRRLRKIIKMLHTNTPLYREVDYEYIESIIFNNDFPLFGNVQLKKYIFSLYYGLFNSKKHTLLEVAEILNKEGLTYSDSTIAQMINDVLLSVNKYKAGMRLKINLSYQDLDEFYRNHKNALSNKDVLSIKRCLDDREIDFRMTDIVNISMLRGSVLLKIIESKHGLAINISEFSTNDAIELLKSEHFSASKAQIIKNAFNINSRDLMSGKEKKKVYKLLSRAYINQMAITNDNAYTFQ